VFTGVVLDTLIDGAFSLQNLVGGLFVAAGLTLNLLFERRASRRNTTLAQEAQK
jgi:hypothetical protein